MPVPGLGAVRRAVLAAVLLLAACGEAPDGFPEPVPVAATLTHPSGLTAPLPVGFAVAAETAAGWQMAEIGTGAPRRVTIAMAETAPATGVESRWLPDASREVFGRVEQTATGWRTILWRAERRRWLVVTAETSGTARPGFRAAWTVFRKARPNAAAGDR